MMMNNVVIKRFVLLALLIASISGCVWVEGTDDLKKYVSKIQDRPAKPIQPIPDFRAYEAFVYEGTRLRNPFLPVVQYVPSGVISEKNDIDAGNTPAPDNERLKDYLEIFDIDDLYMVGNISKGKDNIWALIVDTKGEIHRLTKDDYLGLDHGKVVSVSENKINIIETISNGRGGWVTRPRSIELVETKDP
jgi:type IV pilus assembly protein PilP